MKTAICLAIYLAFGIALHALMLGPTIEPGSAWSLGWIAGWPVLLIAYGFKWFLITVAVVVAIVCIWLLWDNLWFRAYRNELARRRS
ncbi:hypothetical protein [Bosea massiliensis]|uniref:DUF4175 domain-containing protein n=1 Tax=Bosea massiliensis TaxID=151419 RepID=A0ABW0P9Z9_9HYPH